MRFILEKMKVTAQEGSPVAYQLADAKESLALNPLLGQEIRLTATGQHVCLGCQRVSKKPLTQGFCFPCSRGLARADMCIVRPELCHFEKGSCREPEWGVTHCMIPHTLYLANSSGLKVGITRAHQRMTRWIDQGAVEALAILNLPKRLEAGLAEVRFKAHFADKTNWRNMLKGDVPAIDLIAEKERALALVPDLEGEKLDLQPVTIEYPVLEHPKKIVSLNLAKTPEVKGRLLGIKGQYLILDVGVLNVRSHSGFEVHFEA